MVFSEDSLKQLIKEFEENDVIIEGALLNVIDIEKVPKEYKSYFVTAIEYDRKKRVKRSEINKELQRKSKELEESVRMVHEEKENAVKLAELAKEQTTIAMSERIKAENAEAKALTELGAQTKQNQFALIDKATTYLLWFIGAIIALSFVAWVIAVNTDGDDSVMSNVFSGVLTNSLVGALSLLGGAIGVKSVSGKSKDGSTENLTSQSSFFDNNPPSV